MQSFTLINLIGSTDTTSFHIAPNLTAVEMTGIITPANKIDAAG